MNLQAKDWIWLAGVVVSVITFVLKLRADSQNSRYRETINFIEKREKEMHEIWAEITALPAGSPAWSDKLKIFFGRLELVSLMVTKKGFDGEIVYNFWW